MIQKKQLFFPTMSRFLLKKISADADNTTYVTGSLDSEPVSGEPDVMWQSVVYIAETRQIWTNGTLFCGGSGGGTKESTFAEGTEAQVTIGGLSAGTEIGGRTAQEVLETILSPEYAPKWTAPSVVWTNRSAYSGKVYEVGATFPTSTTALGLLATSAASATGGSYSAYGGSAGTPEATGTCPYGETAEAGTYTIGYSVTFAAGTDIVRSNKGRTTRKTASNTTTLLTDASENANVDADYTIKAVTVTDSVTIYATYAVYATTSAISTLAKQTLSTATTLTLAMPAETASAKHSFSIPSTYRLTGVKVLNTLSGKYETYDMSLFTTEAETRIDAAGRDVAYTRYTRNDGTNGATTFQITFRISTIQ